MRCINQRSHGTIFFLGGGVFPLQFPPPWSLYLSTFFVLFIMPPSFRIVLILPSHFPSSHLCPLSISACHTLFYSCKHNGDQSSFSYEESLSSFHPIYQWEQLAEASASMSHHHSDLMLASTTYLKTMYPHDSVDLVIEALEGKCHHVTADI